MARSASRERLSKLHRGETTRVYPIWRAARELTVAFGPTVSFINASYGYYRPFIPVSTREEGERESIVSRRAPMKTFKLRPRLRTDRPVNFPRKADTITGPRIISGSRLWNVPFWLILLRTNEGRRTIGGTKDPPHPVLRLIKSINETKYRRENGVPTMERERGRGPRSWWFRWLIEDGRPDISVEFH